MFKLKHEGLDKRKGKDAAPTIAKIVEIQGHKYITLNFSSLREEFLCVILNKSTIVSNIFCLLI